VLAYSLRGLKPERVRTGREDAPLSAREREVATLIGQGLTNRQIGETLVVAERTVATHIEHILGKLGFGSRTQIGVWAAQQGLLESN
jgi:non-specific serine/threonine protein kinase